MYLSPQKYTCMKNTVLEDIGAEKLLNLETDLELAIAKEPDFVKGLFWGKPRFGHPEGMVVLHIQEVLENVDRISSHPDTRSQLRLITLAHDTFKFQEDKDSRPRDWTKHHGVLAKIFMSRFTQDQAVLDILELHDEAYYCWRLEHIYRDAGASRIRLAELLNKLGDNLQLYYLFFKCDTRTGDKNQAPLLWFEENIKGIKIINI